MLGKRARIGLVIPANNTVIEPEMYALGLEGVTFHATRVIGSRTGAASVEGLRAIVDEAERAIETLAIAGVDLIAYACLSTSLYNEGWEERFQERVKVIAGVPALTAFEATIGEIRRLDPRALLLLDPYGPTIHERLAPALEERGIKSIGSYSLNLPGLQQVCRTPPAAVASAVRELLDGPGREADAVTIFATDLQTMASLPAMNAECGRPVISTNQAMISEIASRLSIPLQSPVRSQDGYAKCPKPS